MARYERDFIGRVRGMWNRIAGDDDRGPRPMMDASGPGAEGYYLTRGMAYDAEYNFSRGDRGGYDRGYGMAQFGRAGRGRGYGGDFQTGRGGPDRDEFFVNRRPGDSGYSGGAYERDLGPRGGMRYAAGQPRGRGYGDEYGGGQGYRGFPMGYDRGYRVGRGGLHNPYDMDAGLRGYYSGTSRAGGVIGQTSTEPGMVYPPDQGGRAGRMRIPRGYGR